MDRIETQGTNAIVHGPKAGGARQTAAAAERPAAGGSSASVAVTVASSSLSGAQAPVDHDRVAEIRAAVEQGRYPIVPAKIADAMIAAGYLLRVKA